MMEQPVSISCGSITLEGLLRPGDPERGVVVTHPHPLYGGDMHNHVVQTVITAYAKAGFTTLRFNFRGVGRSQGKHDSGLGEQEDVKQAAAELLRRGVRTLHLAGYSFGTWVNARALDEIPEVAEVIMVSPPVDFMDFSFLKDRPRIRLVITGERDDIAGAAHVAELITQWNPDASFHVIPGAEHFYGMHTDALEAILGRHLKGDEDREGV